MPENHEFDMMHCIENLWYRRRDIVSSGFDESLKYLQNHLPLKIHEISSGTKCWTWTVPEKWEINEAFIEDAETGQRILDLANHPLHVISYSLPIDSIVSRHELLSHIKTNPQRPDAIPFGYKYYDRDWGFCMPHSKLEKLKGEKYRVVIRSSFEKGTLKVGDCTVPGETDETIVILAHLCHPAMVNDDLSGVAVVADVIQTLQKTKNYYTYKALFVPETIGSIAYLSQNEKIIPHVKYGLFLEMLGNDNTHALQRTRQDDSKLDRMARSILKNNTDTFREGAFRKIVCNDEMVWNGPGVDIPTISLSRFPYPEYHSSDDNLGVISEKRLFESRDLILKLLSILDRDYMPKRTFKGPVFLSGYGLFVNPETDLALNRNIEQIMLRLEGRQSVFEISDELDLDFDLVLNYLDQFHRNGLITKIPC
ncbi:MAG: DUF4910 domain-containing protein [Candidatus Peribacteraceae bacterium]|jgi:aminopeptidase-like protein|nr:DUF4910 domain-containing protein [Candidatus Peribacteraceae bacterium]